MLIYMSIKYIYIYRSPALQADSSPSELPGKPIYIYIYTHTYNIHYALTVMFYIFAYSYVL